MTEAKDFPCRFEILQGMKIIKGYKNFLKYWTLTKYNTFKVLGDLEGNINVASLRRCERILVEREKVKGKFR